MREPLYTTALNEIQSNCQSIAQTFGEAHQQSIKKLNDVCKQAQRAWSGSFLGYHSTVYYRDLKAPPQGARFDATWGLGDRMSSQTYGEWVDYDYEYVYSQLKNCLSAKAFDSLMDFGRATRQAVSDFRERLISILSSIAQERQDNYIDQLLPRIQQLIVPSKVDIVNARLANRPIYTHDMVALSEGLKCPPHLNLQADVGSVEAAVEAASNVGTLVHNLLRHLKLRPLPSGSQLPGNKVFIGHGGSLAWRDLKDFLNDRLGLKWDEFNRVPVAGKTTAHRLSEMLEDASFAFLIMTAEDEYADGTKSARMNVIHEAGLFQGRLGFNRAIIVLEEGCQEFSNIDGLGQIRFPKGRIHDCFEEIRRVLEREGLI